MTEGETRQEVREEQRGPVLVLTLDRTEKKNALTNSMYGRLADALEAAERDPSTRVVVLRADGDVFTAGNDLGEFARVASGADAGREVGRFLQALATACKPLVAAVQGRAVGVGTTMLLHCDYVVLSEDAELTTPFVSLALVPEAGSSLLLPARVGHVRAFAMFATGDAVTAPEALAWGLANRVVSSGDLEAAAMTAAGRLASQPVGALAATKRLMRDVEAISSTMAREGEIFAQRLRSAEAREAFSAFAERRQPDFAKTD